MTIANTPQPQITPGTSGRLAIFTLLVALPALHLFLQHSGILSTSAMVYMPYVSWALVSALAGWRSLVSARRASARSARIAWAWLGAGAFAWATGIFVEAISLTWIDSYDIIVGARRALYLAYPIMLLTGLFALTSTGSRTLGIVNLANIGVIGCAMLICALLVLLEPVIQSNEGTAYVLFSIADLTTLFTATIVALHLLWAKNSPAFRAAVLLLGVSASVHAAANIGFYLDEYQQGFYAGNLDVYWLIAFMLHFWAAHEQDASPQNSSGTASRAGWIERSANASQVMLPAALIVGVLAVAYAFSGHLTTAFAKTALLPITVFALFLGLREWALDRHRQRLVDELHDSNTLNKHVLRSSPGVVVICRTSQGFPVSYVSENGRLLFGIDTSDFNFDKYVHPDDRLTVQNCLKTALNTGISSCEFRLRNELGEWRWVDQRFVLKHDAEGNPAELIGTLVDITERKNLQRSLEQTQRLESLGRLSGSIAHDFNNLLTTILGFSEVLLGSTTIKNSEREKLAEIKAAGERGAALTRQLLTFSRRHSVSTDVIDLNELIEDMRGMLVRLLGDSGELDFQFCTLPVNVDGNKNQLEQVVMNLVLNAREAMPNGGRVQVSIDVLIAESVSDDDGQLDGRSAVITVTDEGIGMDESLQAQIFDPFFTTKAEGTGLGLATVHGIVRQHSGRINVTSRPGEGTRFDILLPVTQREATIATADIESQLLTGDEHILVVDDEAAITRVIASVLEPMGYTVLTANSAEEAISIARRQPFHLLLSDVVMPECNGYELARRMHKVRGHVPVVYMSGYTDDVLARQQLRDENTPLLQKPLVISQLAAVIRKRLDREHR